MGIFFLNENLTARATDATASRDERRFAIDPKNITTTTTTTLARARSFSRRRGFCVISSFEGEGAFER